MGINLIALDIAEETGVCVLTGSSAIVFDVTHKNPIEQYKLLSPYLIHSNIVIENFVYFSTSNSRVTVLSLIERLGYIKYKLIDDGYTIELLNPTSYQANVINFLTLRDTVKQASGKSKKKRVLNAYLNNHYGINMSYNMTDALSMIIYKLQKLPKKVEIKCL